MDAGTAPNPGARDEAALAARSARIDRLLGQLQGEVSAPAWALIQELMADLVGLYGAGLERLLELARTTTRDPAALREALIDDRVIASLLVVHGLHPQSLEERVQSALERVQPYLGSHAGGVELSGIEPDGTVRLTLQGSCCGCASSTQTVEGLIRKAIEALAPEVPRVEVVSVEPDGELVKLRATESA